MHLRVSIQTVAAKLDELTLQVCQTQSWDESLQRETAYNIPRQKQLRGR